MDKWRIAPLIQTIYGDGGAWVYNHNRDEGLYLDPSALSLWTELRICRAFSRASVGQPSRNTSFTLPRDFRERVRTFISAGMLEPEIRYPPLKLPRSALPHLRMTSGLALHQYLSHTALWQKLGNTSFAQLIRDPVRRQSALENEIDLTPARRGFVLYHAWLPGLIHLSPRTARTASRTLAAGDQKAQYLTIPDTDLTRRWATAETLDLDALVEKCMTTFVAIQNRYELRDFLSIVQRLKPQTIVEIGTARGGMLYCLSQIAGARARLASIDLPGAANCGGQTKIERRVFSSFGPRSQTIRFFPFDSHQQSTRRALKRWLNGAEIDLLFIDGDHSYEGVKLDFEMYGPLVRKGGIIAFHDICMFPEEWGSSNAVGVFWREVSRHFHAKEIIDPSGTSTRGKKPDEDWRWGIGILHARC
jgi:predicted O-methyltransferase YrrM